MHGASHRLLLTPYPWRDRPPLTLATEVTEHINNQPYLSIKKILVPVKDKRKLREVLEDHEISCVINVSRSRAPDTNDADYASRRAAVDFGIPVSILFTVFWHSSSILSIRLIDSSRPSGGDIMKLTPQLINNAKLAVLFTETLAKKFHNSPLPYVEGTNPSEVKVSHQLEIARYFAPRVFVVECRWAGKLTD